VVDACGGTDAVLRVLLSEHRHLRGVALDRPSVVESSRREIAAAGLEDRDALGAGRPPAPPLP
jgi:hypothetical protein